MGTAKSYIGACATSSESPLMVTGINTNNDLQQMGYTPYIQLLESAMSAAAASERKVLQSLIHLAEMAGVKRLQSALDVAIWYEVRAPHIKVIEVDETDEIETPQKPAPGIKSSSTIRREQWQREVAPYLSVLGKMKEAAAAADKRTASMTPADNLQRAAIVTEFKASQLVERDGLNTAVRKDASGFQKVAG